MKKTILTIFALAAFVIMAFVITGCNDKDKEPEPTPPPVEENPMAGAVYMLTSFVDEKKKDINDGTRSFDQGKILTWMKDGSFFDDVFEKANPEKELGFSAKSFSIKDNKVFILSLVHPQKYEPRITILDNNTLKIEKDIMPGALTIQGVPEVPLGMYAVSSKKAYLFYGEKAFVVDLETGKKTKEIDGFKEGFVYSAEVPLLEINDKLYGLLYDVDYMKTTLVTIDTKTDVIQYTPMEAEVPVQLLLKDKDNNFLVFGKGILDETWKFFQVSTDGKVLKEKERAEKFSSVAAVSPDEPVIFYQGTGDAEKIIYKWNYETDKTEVFADLKTNKPKYNFYQMRFAIHPQTKELIVGVVDAIYTKLVRVYDSKATTLPVNHKREYAYNGKFGSIQGFVFNTNNNEKTMEK